MRNIAPTNRPILQRTMLNLPASNRSLQSIRSRLNGEICQRDLEAVAGTEVRQAEVAGAHVLGGDLQLVVAAVVAFLPLQLFVVAEQEGGLGVCFSERGVGAEGGVGGDSCVVNVVSSWMSLQGPNFLRIAAYLYQRIRRLGLRRLW